MLLSNIFSSLTSPTAYGISHTYNMFGPHILSTYKSSQNSPGHDRSTGIEESQEYKECIENFREGFSIIKDATGQDKVTGDDIKGIAPTVLERVKECLKIAFNLLIKCITLGYKEETLRVERNNNARQLKTHMDFAATNMKHYRSI